MTQEKKNQIIKSGILLAVFLIILIMEIATMTKMNDDLWFGSLPIEGFSALLNFILFRFINWSSRIFIETILIWISSKPIILFEIINALFVVLIVWDLYYLTAANIEEENFSWKAFALCACAIFLYYPLRTMDEAGWIATCLNYLWPTATLLYAFVVIRKQRNGQKIHWWDYLLFVLATLFGANTEQTMVVATCVLFAYGLFEGKEDLNRLKSQSLYWILCSVTVFEWALFLLSPGNQMRSSSEIETRFPEFADFSFFQKVDIGITSASRSFFLLDYQLVFLLTLIIFLSYILSNRHVIDKILSIIPFVITVGTYVVLTDRPNRLSVDKYFSLRDGLWFVEQTYSWKVYAIYIGYLVFFALILYLLLKRFNFNKTSWIMGITFILAMATKAMMGMSPTVWDSRERTSFFMIISLIYIVLLLNNHFKGKEKILTSCLILCFAIYIFGLNFAALPNLY